MATRVSTVGRILLHVAGSATSDLRQLKLGLGIISVETVRVVVVVGVINPSNVRLVPPLGDWGHELTALGTLVLPVQHLD